MKDAACVGSDPRIFFPETSKERRNPAWAPICGSCPVRQQCYDTAYHDPDLMGVWGGHYFSKHSRRSTGERITVKKSYDRILEAHRRYPQFNGAMLVRHLGLSERIIYGAIARMKEEGIF